jgi:hypothetical protein
LEHEGRQVAKGNTLVHFDLYAHNILLTPHEVYFVDWPHARLGAPFVDLVMLLSTVTTDGTEDPERIVAEHPLTAAVDPHNVDALLAAHAGFCMAGALTTTAPKFTPIRDAKLALGRMALAWLTPPTRPPRDNDTHDGLFIELVQEQAPSHRTIPRTNVACPACWRSSEITLTKRTPSETGGSHDTSTMRSRWVSVRPRTYRIVCS